LFFLAMIVLAGLGIYLRQPVVALALPAIYLAALIAVAISVIPKKGLAVAALVPLALATIHFAYALGIAYGGFALLFHPRAWDQSGTMSTLNR
jgi:hypothetical protein